MKFFRKKEKQPETAENQQPKVKNTLLQTYFTSLLSLVLCVGMFFGTSYAWFTSEVTNMGNEIYIGILDVELEKQSGDKWLSLSEKSNQASINHLFSEEIHWEPGYTALETIRITNKGELDFRYVLNFTDGTLSTPTTPINATVEGASALTIDSVAQYFNVWVYAHPAAASTESTASPAPEASAEPAFTKPNSYDDITKRDSGWVNAGSLADLLNGKTVLSGVMTDVTDDGPVHTYTIALHMDDEATSAVMGHRLGLNVKLTAYQTTSEYDAFSNTYDIEAFAGQLAQVNELTNTTIRSTNGIGGSVEAMTLDTAYQFLPTETLEDLETAPYKDWHADFVVSADKDVTANSMALAGYYQAWCQFNNNNWVALKADEAISANTEIRLVKALGVTVSFEEICKYGNDGIGFLCGAADLAGANAGTTITVELRMYETDESLGELSSIESETGRCITVGTFTYTFPETGSGQ